MRVQYLAIAFLVAVAVTAQAPPAATPAAQPASGGGAVSGRVLSIRGEPLNKVELVLRRSDRRGGFVAGRPGMPQEPSFHSASTDPSGAFRFGNVEPGRYFLSAQRFGYVAYDGADRARGGSGAAVEVGAGGEVSGVEVRMTPQSVITGKVLDEDGDPLPRTSVQAVQQRYVRGRRQFMTAAFANANDIGEYRLAGLPPGRYYLVASRADDGVGPRRRGAGGDPQKVEYAYPTMFYPNASEAAQAQPLEIGPGVDLRNLDFRLTKVRTFRIRGNVLRAADNSAMQNTMVMLSPRMAGPLGFMTRSVSPSRTADGTFELSGITPGEYTLFSMVVANQTDRLSGQADVSVVNQDVEGVQLRMLPMQSVSGRLRSESAEEAVAFSGISLVLEPMRSQPMNTATAVAKEDGSFQFTQVYPERYRLNVTAGGSAAGGFYVKAVLLSGREVSPAAVDLTAGGELEVVLSPAGGSIEGTALNRQSEPQANALAVLAPEGPLRDQYHLYRRVLTGQDGKFSMTGLAPGEYKVFVWEEVEDEAWLDPAFLEAYEAAGVRVKCKERSTETLQVRVIPKK